MEDLKLITTPAPEAVSEKGTQTAADFEAIRLRLASPDQIRKWSHGEVTKPETINYRTQKPEKDGLFSEEIFGPTKDWECYCGKYKRIRYKGIVCDKCGVEVTRSIVRRERMGHIQLAVPVSHIWFLRGVPSKIGTVLDLSVQQLEKVVYFASYIIMEVNVEARDQAFKQIDVEFKSKKREIDAYFLDATNRIKQEWMEKMTKAADDKSKKNAEKGMDEALAVKNEEKQLQYEKLEKAVETAKKELRELQPLRIISEVEYRDLSMKYGHIFRAGIGAEALRQVVEKIDLGVMVKQLENESKTAVASKKKKIVRRLKILKSMHKAKIRPEWMFLTMLPVLPPDLRPMVPLDGGRYAASDLNDLYRRVINRNNRLKRLIEINSPEVITRNEKRMLQEAVDALIDNNARRGKAVAATTGQKRTLKSLADMLKGKQGRFRQNLLGKRVDYSGRSVIVVGSKLKLHQCGLPKRMALELYKPFIIHKLIEKEYAYNVRSASKLIEQERPEVWDMLEEAIQGTHVLLNRAPTLHRLGIQAFEPQLIEGKAIKIHPMVCTAFNADFDGDQMAVHLPLTQQAKQEAKEIMLSSHNLLKPANGEPVVSPTKDIVLGAYYMTGLVPGRKGEGKIFSYSRECILAYEFGLIDINAKIKVRLRDQGIVETCAGRILFNLVLPKELWFQNEQMDKKKLNNLIIETLERFGRERAAQLIDDIKEIGYEHLTLSGMSWGMDDLTTPSTKAKLVEDADKEVEIIYDHYKNGLLTDDERYDKVLEIWTRVKDRVTDEVKDTLPKNGTVFSMIESGARGSWGQVTQMMGMKGLVANPAGRIIELPVKGNFKEGFDVLEYFISTHGTRKGMADTALRTANAGYLTRRLVDVSQDVVVEINDCGDKEGIEITANESEAFNLPLQKRLVGRYTTQPVVDAKTGEVLVEKDTLITKEHEKKLENATIHTARIRSVLTCAADRGVCQKCYGYDLGSNAVVTIGQAVGIVAAQAIGEPGTQLTMRTFHTGGVASSDITQGLPRVEELFEARQIKKPAPIAHIDGKIRFEEKGRVKTIVITSQKLLADEYQVDDQLERIKVKDGEKVETGQILAIRKDKEKIKAENSGTIKLTKNKIIVQHDVPLEKEYLVPAGAAILVQAGQEVHRGDKLTEGSLDLRELFEISGADALQKYILQEVQSIYMGQGQDVNDKHIEIIVRQMLSRVRIVDSGDTEFLPDEVVTKSALRLQNEKTEATGGKPATCERLLLGITKASLSTDSFLSAASFQETAKVLIDAAISSKVDYLVGLKENVIIGKLIPSGQGYEDRRKKITALEDLVPISDAAIQTSERIGAKKR